jgi:hypothetical protein
MENRLKDKIAKSSQIAMFAGDEADKGQSRV